METNRFETFYDAVLAIVITILVLKIPQPLGPGFGDFFSNNLNFVTYGIVFLAIMNIWFSNQNLFNHIEEIDNKAIFVYGFSIFLTTLLPYFASWLSLNVYSLAAEAIFGLLIIFSGIFHIISVYAIYGANRYNEKLAELNIKKVNFLVPIAIMIVGFIISFTVYVPGIYVASIISVILNIIYNRVAGKEIEDTERFEALIDAIIAIIITIIVLEIPTALNGSLGALLDLKMEFIAYIISFIVCFNVWNFTYNLFTVVKKINYAVIWYLAAAMFFLSLIPYLTTYVAMNFYDFVPQFLYGLDFIIISICSVIATYEMKKADDSNQFLQALFRQDSNFISICIFAVICMIVGYLFWPPLIIISCLFSVVVTWVLRFKNITLLDYVKL